MIELLKAHSFFADKAIESCTLLENQGYCNENYIVIADGVKYIVRSFQRNDADRQQEFNLQKQAFNIGIAPNPLILDLKNGFSIMEFIEGVHKKNLDIMSLYMLVDCIGLLHDQVFLDNEMIEIRNLLKSRNEEILDALETIDFYMKEPVVCHNDLNPLNILWQSDKPILLDFEYASVNDCYFDLAALSIEFTLKKEEDSLMLRRYFSGGYYFREKFEAYKVLYKALCAEWFKENT